MGYSYIAFRQSTLLYEQHGGSNVFHGIGEDVVEGMSLHDKFVTLLEQVAKTDHVRAIVVTCGMRSIWGIYWRGIICRKRFKSLAVDSLRTDTSSQLVSKVHW